MISLLAQEFKQISLNNNDYVDFETLFLVDYTIKHCKGCRACMDYGEENCPLTDDIPLIKAKIKESDAVIFASPVYVGDINSLMKALIDRLAYVCHRQEFYDKSALILATTNATSLKRTIRTMGAAIYSWGFKLIGAKGFKTLTSYDSLKTIQQKHFTDISKLARKLYLAIRNKSFHYPSVISLATFKIQQKYRSNPEQSSSIDYTYWKKHGWTEQNRNYYIDFKASFLKKLCSRILYKLLLIIF